ncbi:MAG: hypothetical protein AAF367_01440 [Pseudomonadota bacterium]
MGTTPILHVEEDDGFWALVELRERELHLVISTGCVSALDDLWKRALANGVLVNDDGLQPANDVLVHVSLVWLILHELQHYDLGHFEKVGTAFLAETERGRQFALARRRDSAKAATQSKPGEEEIEEMYRLEMEADADAIEMLLDAYSDDQWEELRYRIACVAAVMVLIDRADAALPEGQSLHPPAKHRIAQLQALVVQMWAISASPEGAKQQDGHDPSLGPSEHFKERVLVPVFRSVEHLLKVEGRR